MCCCFRHIIVVDTTTNDLVLTTEDAVVSSRVNLYRSYTSSSAVLWPRSIAVRWSYNDTFYTSSINTTLPCDTAVVYVGEYLGKIWKININICLDRIVQSRYVSVGFCDVLLHMAYELESKHYNTASARIINF